MGDEQNMKLTLIESVRSDKYLVDYIYHGSEYVFASIESLYLFDFKFYYNFVLNSYPQFYENALLSTIQNGVQKNVNQLTKFSLFSDKHHLNYYLYEYYTQYLFKTTTSNSLFCASYLHNPELLLSQEVYKQLHYLAAVGASNGFINKAYIDSYFFFFHSIEEFLVGFSVIMFFGFIFCSYYSNVNREENTVDFDYLNTNLLVASEKEISALDDILNLILLFFFLFGWYIQTNTILQNENLPEFALIFMILPLVYYCLFFIPIFLIYDFGFFFIAYIRGGATSPLVLGETTFDYMAGFSFFLRTFVQNVRFLIILFVCHGINEVLIYSSITPRLFSPQSPLWSNYKDIEFSLNSLNYYLVGAFIGQLLYLYYELFHTFFVLIVQFSAFLAMVFWLFSFLYTYFTLELPEHYYSSLRNDRLALKTYKQLKSWV
jgi:hypothetical protein